MSPNHFYVAANEFVAANLARELDLPILDFRVLCMDGNQYFASAYMDEGTYYNLATEELFSGCINRHRAAQAVVFDVWICNIDRHAWNLIVRKIIDKRSQQTRLLMLLNDHSHCLVPPGQSAKVLSSLVSSPPENYMRHLPFLTRAALEDRNRLIEAIRRTQLVSAETIKQIVHGIPDAWLQDSSDREQLIDFLVARQSRLAGMFRQWGVEVSEAAS